MGTSGGTERGRDDPVTLALAFLVSYVALAAWAEQFAVTPDGRLSVWYPPPGIVLVILHIRGLRYWPVAIAGEVAAGLWVYDITDAFGVPRVLLNAVLVTGAYAVGAEILRRGGVDPGFARRRHLAVFVTAAFLVAAPLAAALGTAMQVWAGFDLEDGVLTAVAQWWVGDAIGMLVLAPVGYALLRTEWSTWVADAVKRLGWFEVVEAVAVVGFPILVFNLNGDPYRLLYLPMLPVAIVAIRHGAGPAGWAVLASVTTTTVSAHATDAGTIGRTDLQLLLLTLGMTGGALGALERFRRQTFERALELQALVEASPDLVAVVDEDGGVAWLNPAGRRLLGCDDRDEGATTASEDDLLRNLDDGAVATALDRGSWRGSARLRRGGEDGDEELRLSQLVVALPGPRRRAGVVARDVTDLHRVADQLTRLAFVDELTGLANRARLFERLGFALERSTPGDTHGLILVDLDRFASLNDHLGHDVGDQVLRRVADGLSEVVRAGELLARVGDDRFAVLVEDVDEDSAAIAVAERLRLAACVDTDEHLAASVLTASAAVVLGTVGDDPDVLLRRADLALQRAKRAGGATTMAYDATLSEQLTERIRIERLLRDALDGAGWPLRYQPVVDLATGAIVSCEALLEPLAPPLAVVGVAEELGLIGRLGQQVLATALDQAVRWRRRVPGLRMGVNVSALQLADPRLPAAVEAELARVGLPGDALVLEVTETAFSDDQPQVAVAAARLQALGICLSIDDFGTGFSSLGRLRSLPADELKLDRTFVADLGQLPGAAAIVAAVVALGEARQLKVVAEGVEEESQRVALLDLGCRVGQGWLFAHPMAPEAFDVWLDGALDRAGSAAVTSPSAS